jgi:hypothetical protein
VLTAAAQAVQEHGYAASTTNHVGEAAVMAVQTVEILTHRFAELAKSADPAQGPGPIVRDRISAVLRVE